MPAFALSRSDVASARERPFPFLHLAPAHPLIAHHLRTADPTPTKISDPVPHRPFRASELYRAVHGPVGVEFRMAVTLPSASGTVVGKALNRDRRDSADREAADATAGMLELVLADRRQAAVALSLGGDTVAAASARAPGLLRAYLPRPARPAALPEPLAQWLARARSTGAAPAGPFTADGPEGTLVGRLLVAATPEGHDVLLLEERRRDDGRALAALAAMGLSARQAEVLALAARGWTNAEIAARMGISPRTVQKHLEHVFDRLGVRTRAGAAARAAAAMAGEA